MLRVEIGPSNAVVTSQYYLLYIDKSILKKLSLELSILLESSVLGSEC